MPRPSQGLNKRFQVFRRIRTSPTLRRWTCEWKRPKWPPNWMWVIDNPFQPNGSNWGVWRYCEKGKPSPPTFNPLPSSTTCQVSLRAVQMASFIGNKSVEHMPLVVGPSTHDLEEDAYEAYRPRQRSCVMTREKWLFFVIVLQAMALLGGILIAKNKEVAACQCRPQGLLYCWVFFATGINLRTYSFTFANAAPAQSIVEYEVKSFTPGREHKTIYQGLSDEADRAWEDLYNRTLNRSTRAIGDLLTLFWRCDYEDSEKWSCSSTQQDLPHSWWTGILPRQPRRISPITLFGE